MGGFTSTREMSADAAIAILNELLMLLSKENKEDKDKLRKLMPQGENKGENKIMTYSPRAG